MALNNEFKVKNSLNTLGQILSSGVDIADIFAPSNTSWTLATPGDTFSISGTETLTLQDGNGISVRGLSATETVLISGINATNTTRGVASFDSDDFTVTNGAVTIKTGGVDNDQLKTASTTNTPNYVVIRDGSGGFAAGSINVTGSVIATQDLSAQQTVYGTKLVIDNVEIDNNTITTLNTNGDLIIDPNGSGQINLQGDTVINGTLSSNNIIYGLGGGSLQWNEAFSTIQSTSAIGRLTETVVTDLEVGNISAAQIIPEGTTFQEFVEAMFIKTFFPTFTAPSITTVSSSIGTSVEAGTEGLTVTVTFLSGTINGQTVNGVWNPSLAQNTRSGLLTGGQIFDAQVNSRSATNQIAATSATRIILDGNNVFNVRADYEQGPQPKDSRGNDFSTPLPAGSVTSSVTVAGRRRGFWGAETGPTGAPTTSNEIRALPSNVLNPAVNTSYTINIPVGATRITFAYPVSLGLANGSGSEPAFKDMTNNFDYTSEFGSPTTVAVEGANGFAAVNYYVYSYTPAVPIPGAFSLRLII